MNSEAKKPSRRWPKIVLALLLVGAATASIGWLIGPRVWTDGKAIRAAGGKAALRDVLWDPPHDLGPAFASDQHQYEPALSPDGTEFYFVRNKPGRNSDIYVSYRRNNQWTPPVALEAVNSPYDDLGPRLTPDGKFLLFYSDRPGGFGGYDIWAAPRTEDGWGTPFNLGPRINTEYNEFSPDPTPDGRHLIFSTNRKAASGEQKQAWRATIRQTENGDYDLWIAEIARVLASAMPGEVNADRSEHTGHGRDARVTTEHPDVADYDTSPTKGLPRTTGVPPVPATQSVENSLPAQPSLVFLPAQEIAGVNTPYMEGASCMSPAGDFLYFASNRPGGFGKFDIYRSRVFPGEAGQWKFAAPQNVGPQINTADNETDPALALNGFRLYLSSDRGNADGLYRLLSSDSREVYPTYEGRPLPHLGMSFWLMLMSLLVLIPLLLFLRGWDERRLGILQKCLLLSLLAHVAICFLLSFLNVTTQAIHCVRQEMGIELPIALSAPGDLDVGYSIRRQSTNDLQVPGAPIAEVSRSEAPVETVAVPGSLDVNVPAAHVQPGEVMLQFAAPIPTLVGAKPQAAEVAPAAPMADAFDVRVALPRAVSQAETALQVSSAEAQLARAMIPGSAKVDVPAITSVATPSVAPSSTSLSAALTPAPSSPPPQATAQASVIDARVSPIGDFPAVNLATSPNRPQASEQTPANAAAMSTPALLSVAMPTPAQSSTAPRSIEIATVAAQPGNAPTALEAQKPDGFRPQAISVTQAQAAPGTTDMFTAPVVGSPNNQRVPEHVTAVHSRESTATEEKIASAPQARPAISSARPQIETALPTTSAPAHSQLDTSSPGLLAQHRAAAIDAIDTARPQAFADANGSSINAPSVNVLTAIKPRLLSEPSPPTPADATTPTTRPILIASVSTPNENSRNLAVEQHPVSAPAVSPAASSLVREMDSLLHPVQVDQSHPANSGPDSIASTIVGVMEAPSVSLPKALAPTGAGGVTRAGGGAEKLASADAIAFAASRTEHGLEGGGGPKNVYVDSGISPVSALRKPAGNGRGSDPLQSHIHATAAVPQAVAPPVLAFVPAPTDFGPTLPAVPDSPFKMRAPEQHQPVLEKLGGTIESENAVDRGLKYLASVQELDGRWSIVGSERRTPRIRPPRPHDPACTGLALLAILAQDHRPDKPGPYQEKLAQALDFLVSIQRDNGDLRGPLAGGGADQGNMYDHGIATFALAEAALMTRDPRYVEAALKGAAFIVAAQDSRQTGGWRYIPREAGDSSVFGWQAMALHSAEQLGFEIPVNTRRGALRYIAIASSGDQHMLAGYQPLTPPTAPMTAEIVFSRMLFGQQLNEDETQEVSSFLGSQPPSSGDADIYYWYYGSLCMMQMQNDDWKRWNTRTRDMLVRSQHRIGDAGYWDNMRWSERGGRVFTTAMATLTLEVYYRYMPMQKKE